MRRNLFFVVFVFVCSGCLFAREEVTSGEKKLRVIETKWFDIIFQPGSEATARLLAGNADRIYEEVFAEFGAEPVSRMPITVMPAVETVNAYFSAAPYNFIVVYDYVPEVGQGESFAIFSENLLGIFRHEIGHAVTFQLKTPGWQLVGKIFGEVINPAYLFVPNGLAEGTSVVLESEGGEGRLNDSYSMHTVRQAKLEGKFPEWRDIQGAADFFPYGSYYQINGAFYQWLREKYGTEKFAELWYRCVNFETISFRLSFMSIYGKSVQRMWRDFAADLQVPDVAATEDFAEDAFNFARGKDGYKTSLENRSAARYVSLAKSSAGLACIDDASQSVLFFKKNDDGTFAKPKVLFRRTGITKINFSSDGKLMAVSYVSLSDSTTRRCVSVYDVERNRFFDVDETGLRDPEILVHGGKEYLACVKTSGQKTSLVFYDINRKKSSQKHVVSEIRKAERFGENAIRAECFEAGDNEIISNIVDCGFGRIAYLLKSPASWKIVAQDLSGKKTLYEMPEGMAIRSLSWEADDASESSSGGAFYFSCATIDTLPRLAKMRVDGTGAAADRNSVMGKAELFVQSENINGGVFSPVYFDEFVPKARAKGNAGGDRFFYSAEFFRNTRLLTVPGEKINFVVSNLRSVENVTVPDITANDVTVQVNETVNLYETKKYVPFKYYGGGIFLPASLASAYSLNGYDMEAKQLLLGATFATSNPWAASIFIFSGGINPSPFEAVLSAQVTGGTETSFLEYSASANVGFDKNGFVNTVEEASFNISVPFARYLSFVGGDDLAIFYGHSFAKKQNASEAAKMFDSLLTTQKFYIPWAWSNFYAANASDIFIAVNKFTAGLSTIHKMGSGRYESGGVSLELIYNIDYAVSHKFPDVRDLLQNIGSVFTVRLPYLLPVKNINRHTYNLPLEASFSIFPESDIFWQVATSMVLYSYDVQRALPFFTPLFVNRFSIFAEYQGNLWASSAESWNITNTISEFQIQSKGNTRYDSFISLRLQVLMTPNIGMLGKVVRGDFNALLAYYLGTSNLPLSRRLRFNATFNFLI